MENKETIVWQLDYIEGSGSGCEDAFKTLDDLLLHVMFYTQQEREGLQVCGYTQEGECVFCEDVDELIAV